LKTIKFNIIVNDVVIRNLDELKANFNIDDVFELYKNGTLQKWLKVREYEHLSEKVNRLKIDDDRDIAAELLNIFGFDNSKIDFEVWSFIYRRTRNEYTNKLIENNEIVTSVVKEYHQQYEQLKELLLHPVIKKEEV